MTRALAKLALVALYAGVLAAAGGSSHEQPQPQKRAVISRAMQVGPAQYEPKLVSPTVETRGNVRRVDLPTGEALEALKAKQQAKRAVVDDSDSDGDGSKKRASPTAAMYPSGGLMFYENYFAGDSTVYIYWDPADDQRVLVFIGNQAYNSLDGSRTFKDLVDDGLESARDLQAAVYDNAPYSGVRFYDYSEADPSTLMLFGYGKLAWTSRNGGASFTKISLPLYPRTRFTTFHPLKPTWIAAISIDDRCYSPSTASQLVCSNELWVSQDLGESWIKVATHVTTYVWAAWNSGDNDPNNSIYVQTLADKTKPQVTVNSNRVVSTNNNGQEDLYRIDVFQSSSQQYLVATNVYQTVISGDYLFSVRPSPTNRNSADIYVSAHGNSFGLASFKSDHPIGVLFIHDVQSSSVILVERPSAGGSNSYVSGTVWISDGHGLVYSESLSNLVYLDATYYQRYALHKVESVLATHVATTNVNSKLGTLITWNKGAAWNPVRTQANIDGDIDATSNLVLFGATHSTTSRTHTGFYSSATAPGMILAVGSENISVADFQTGNKEGDMYFSRNGGVSFRKVLNSTNFCRFIDEGAAIVCVDIDQTNSLFYSIDEVATRFVNVTFSDNLLYPLVLLSDPNSVGSILNMIGIDSTLRNFMFVSVDLSPLWPRTCDATDYEFWTPNDGRLNGHCILGSRIAYQRIKSGAACQSNIDLAVSVYSQCPCAFTDYECDFGYYYDEDTHLCELLEVASQNLTVTNPTNQAQLVCVNGYYSQPSGYRIIPGDSCDMSMPGSINWASPYMTACPVDNDMVQLATILGISITVLVLIVVGFVGFIWYKRKALYASYRNIPADELAGEIGGGDSDNNEAIRMDNVPIGDDDADELADDVAIVPAGGAPGGRAGKLQI